MMLLFAYLNITSGDTYCTYLFLHLVTYAVRTFMNTIINSHSLHNIRFSLARDGAPLLSYIYGNPKKHYLNGFVSLFAPPTCWLRRGYKTALFFFPLFVCFKIGTCLAHSNSCPHHKARRPLEEERT